MISILAQHYKGQYKEGSGNIHGEEGLAKKHKASVSLLNSQKITSNKTWTSTTTGELQTMHILQREVSESQDDQKQNVTNEAATASPKHLSSRLGNEEIVHIQKLVHDDKSEEDCDVDIDASDDEAVQPEPILNATKVKDPIYSALMQDAGLTVSSDEEDIGPIEDVTTDTKDEPSSADVEPECSSEEKDCEEEEDPYLRENGQSQRDVNIFAINTQIYCS